MIAQIEIRDEYGKDTKCGITVIPDAVGTNSVVFAHSIQDAIEWLTKKCPLFADADVTDLSDGRFIVTSQWIIYSGTFDALLLDENNPRLGAQYTRQWAIIYPRSTIYEQFGYERDHPVGEQRVSSLFGR
jgi:hypothetical protein